MATHHSSYLSTRHFGSLDGLRFLCIAMVLWHHGPILGYVGPQAWSGMAGRGFTGVDFFFVLSGFLITTLLLREQARNGRFSLSGFYWRRALRILPAYYLVVTLVGAYYILLKGQDDLRPLWPLYYAFTANFMASDIPMLSPTWSLSVEEQFYLIWPLLLLCVPGRLILPALAGLISINILGSSGFFGRFGLHGFDLGPLYISMPPYAPILIGAGTAILLNSRQGFAFFWRLFGHPAASLIAFPALLMVLALLPENLRGWPNLVLHLTMAACLISITIREDHWLRPAFTLRPVVRIGAISYGIYLYHLIGRHIAVNVLGDSLNQNLFLIFAVYVMASLLIAEISFRYYESIFLGWRSRQPVRTAAKSGPDPHPSGL